MAWRLSVFVAGGGPSDPTYQWYERDAGDTTSEGTAVGGNTSYYQISDAYLQRPVQRKQTISR